MKNNNSVFVLSREHGGEWQVFSQGEQYLIDLAYDQKMSAPFADEEPITTLDEANDWFGRDLNRFYTYPETPEGAADFVKAAAEYGLHEQAEEIVSERIG